MAPAPPKFPAEHPVSEDLAAQLIRSQFPEVAARVVRRLDEGWDCQVFDVDDAWIFRFPKRKTVEKAQEVEGRLFPELAPTLPLPVPAHHFEGRPSQAFPFRFVGSARIPGTCAIYLRSDAADFAVVAKQVAAFLSALHAFPASDAARLGVLPTPDWRRLESRRERTISRFAAKAERFPPDLARRTLRFLEDAGGVPPPFAGAPRLVHQDFGPDHVLLYPRTGAAQGVIDWVDVSIGDVADDFAGVLGWGGMEFLTSVLGAYTGPQDAGLLDRTRYVSVLSGAMHAWWGVEGDRPEHVAMGLRALSFALP